MSGTYRKQPVDERRMRNWLGIPPEASHRTSDSVGCDGSWNKRSGTRYRAEVSLC